MDTENTDLLLQYALAVASENEWGECELGPIHMIKYAYLGDLDYASRNQGRTFTGACWQFFRFGPWAREVNARIKPVLEAIGAVGKTIHSDKHGEFVRWSIQRHEIIDTLEARIDPLTALAIKGAVRKFCNDTPTLLNAVYQTMPMLLAAPGEYLDFTAVVPDRKSLLACHQPEQMTIRQAKRRKKLLSEIRQSYQVLREAKNAAKASRRYTEDQPAPRYDDVFFQGVETLERLAGDDIPPGQLTCAFSKDFWKSKARHDPSLP